MNYKLLSVAIPGLLLATASFAQMDSVKTAPTQKSGDVSVEVKPIPLIVSVVPGVGAIGIGGEVFVDGNNAVFSNAYYTDINLPNRITGTLDEEAGDPVPDKMTAASVYLGGRRYGDPAGSTWYAGIFAGYGDSQSTWDYGDAGIESRIITLATGFEGGYRWLWSNGILVRAGATIAANNIQSNKTDSDSDTAEAKEGVDKVDDLQTQPVIATADIGFGFAF